MQVLDFFRKPPAEPEHRDPVWELVEAGRYEEARRLHHQQDRGDLYSEWRFLVRDGDILCCLGQFKEAMQAYKKADKIVSEEVPGLRLQAQIAVSQWLAAQPEKALRTLETCVRDIASGRIEYTGELGGADVALLLFGLAALEDRQDYRARALDRITHVLPRLNPTFWPAQLCRFVVGRRSFPELLGATTGRRNLKPALALARKDPVIRRHATQVLFYGGVRHFEDGDPTTALDLFETCVGLNAIIEDEWLLARALCQRLGAG